MKYEISNSITNVKNIGGLHPLTLLTVKFAGFLEFYPGSSLKGEGYHMQHHEWDDEKGLIYCDFYIEEKDLNEDFIRYDNLTDSEIAAIEREVKINEILDDN